MGILQRIGAAAGFTTARSQVGQMQPSRSYPRKTMALPFDAHSGHPAIPAVPVLGPTGTIPYLREQQALARHMLRNDSWIQSLVRVLADLHIGTGPTPRSPFRELNELHAACRRGMSSNPARSHGAMIRQDLYANEIVDGEAFAIRHFRFNRPRIARRLIVPLQYQCVPSDYVPVDTPRLSRGNLKFTAGIATYLDRPEYYAVHRRHPSERSIGMEEPFIFPADQITHVFDGPTGSPRGTVMLATAFLRAIAMSTTEDAERRRKQISAIMNVFFKRTVDAATTGNDSALPTAEKIDEMLSTITLGTGLAHELPRGFEIETVQPKDEPANFEKSLRWQLLAICASAGAPFHEVTGDWADAPERALRLQGASVKRRADIVRQRYDHQVNDPWWVDFVETARAAGLWTPPAGIPEWRIYEVEHDWPVIQAAALTQELNVMLDAADRGYISPTDVTRMYWGKSKDIVDRQTAADHARANELGLASSNERFDATRTDTSKSFAEQAAKIEGEERRIVEESEADKSVLGKD